MTRPARVDRFLGAYNDGDTAAAVRHLLDGPGIEYDALAADGSRGHAILNYADALVAGTPTDVASTGTFLIETFAERSPALAFDVFLSEVRGNPSRLEEVRRRDTLPANIPVFAALQEWVDSDSGHAVGPGRDLPPSLGTLAAPFRSQFALQIRCSAAVRGFWRRHEALHEAMGKPDRTHAPLLRTPEAVLADRLGRACREAGGGLPVILMEPFDIDWAPLLAPLAGQRACFVFRDAASLSHGLSVAAIAETLDDPAHGLIVIDRYPAPQLAAQPQVRGWAGPLCPVVAWDDPELLDRVPAALAAIERVLGEPHDGRESPAANWLYAVGRQASMAFRARRLGASRLHCLRNQIVHENWNDPHKGQPPAGVSTGPPAPDILSTLLARVQPIGPRRRPASHRRLRLAHVTTQVIDGSHAPSRLLRTLMGHHDRQAFDLSLFVTEGFVRRPGEYPTSPWHSPPSDERAPRTLRAFREIGMNVVVARPGEDCRATASAFSGLLSEGEIDVAVFHGPDFIHHAIAAQCDVPLRVLFEHGSLPDRPGFDVAVASAESEEGVERLQPRFAAMGTMLVRNAHVVDARQSWAAQPTPRSALGLPEDALVMTTISNHLEHRLSDEMCGAIAQILERCPRAWYAPMGPVRADSRVARFFAALPVGNRVTFLGSVPAPSQYARSMHLYLNEFPFGGGIALLDALAAGCPLVSMYDHAGPAQARYVGIYYGMDRVVTSLDPKDYVELACRLLTDGAMYEEWRRAAVERYERHTDVRAYVRRFEDIVRAGLARMA